MSDVLIRDVPVKDLARIRSAAAQRGTSLQSYLRDTLSAQAAHLRRQDALARAERRMHGRPGVPDGERDAVLDDIEAAHNHRAAELSDPRH